MSKKAIAWLLVLTFCLTAAIPALAANVFKFTETKITLFEGESTQTTLRREGTYDGDGEITYASGKTNVATVAQDGTITAVGKGQTEVTASLMRNGRRAGQAKVSVTVQRAVKKVTLNTTKLSVYDPDDPTVTALMKKKETDEEGEEEEETHQVLVIPAGTSVTLTASCTPEDASNKKTTFTSTDAGVAKITGTSMRAVQRGECDLIVSSVLNPEVTETLHVLVIQPIKSIKIDAGSRKVAAGSVLQLTAACSPDNASIPKVKWESKNQAIAKVDENGLVTGLKKGTVTITATAADGSRVAASVSLNVTQPVSSVSIAQTEIPVVVGRSVTVRATVQPSNASDRSVSWSTSDERIATVSGSGQVTGRKAGECMLICASKSNPEVTTSVKVVVSQLVTKIENTNQKAELTLKTGESLQTRWNVLPDDATNKGLTFKSNAPKVVTVDAATGMVRAVGRGTATIVATAMDSGRKQGSVKITVIQPVTGVSMQRNLYYIQRGLSGTVRAVIAPKNANNQKVYWSSADERIATIRSNGTSTGSVYGVYYGYTTITACTEDGGFTATATVRVGDFNGAVMVEELYVTNNNIKISMRNMSQDLILENIHYVIECYDTDGNPMICNTDGVSTSFEGSYSYPVYPGERTVHGSFHFKNQQIDQELGAVVLTVTSWKDAEGVTWNIPETEQVKIMWPSGGSVVPGPGTDEGVG